MKRRTFLIGTGSTAIGGSALLGSGAFSRVESQRGVSIKVAEDPKAFLGLDGCPDSPNSSYTELDEKGHLQIQMNDENPNIGKGENARGVGVNSDSRTWFHRVFQICNQGKQTVCIWIEDDDDWPRVGEADSETFAGDRRVDFYLEDDDERSIVGQENHVELEIGECVCIGLKTNTKSLSEGDELLEDLDNEIKLIADEECPPEVPPEDLGAICGKKKLTKNAKDQFDLEGWIIELYDGPDREVLLDSTITDDNGEYCFLGLAPGTYYVCEVPEPGSIPIDPDDGCREVEVGEGETVENINFLNDSDDEPFDEAPRTIGFWSNWSGECTPGGQENFLGQTLDAAEGLVLGDLTVTREDHAEPPNCGAVNILTKRDLDGIVRANDGAYDLAAQLLAAKLNEAAGAPVPGDGTGDPGEDCEDVRAQIDAGQDLLDGLGFDGTGSYLPPQTANRQEALDIADCLDRYNNGEFTS